MLDADKMDLFNKSIIKSAILVLLSSTIIKIHIYI